LTLLL
jgi:hypothetical protein